MRRTIHRLGPVVAIGLATLLGGCVVYPDGGYYRHGWGWGWHDHGWHDRGWR